MEKIEFKDRKVNNESLVRILEAGCIAPTAKNLQPQKIYVINSDEELEKLNKVANLHNARTVLVVCGDTKEAYKYNYYTSYRTDATLVAIHMILEATHLGIDNMLIKEFNVEKVQEELKLDLDIVPVSLILLGYKTDDSVGFKATDFNINLLPSQRKGIDEIVKYI